MELSKIKYLAFSVILSLLFATVFIRTDEIYKGFQNTWYFYFILIASIIIILVLINLILIKREQVSRISFNIIDLFVIIFFVYSFIRLLFTKYETFNNHQFLILLFLTSLYFVWKGFFVKNFKQETINLSIIILISVFLLSGLAEAILGILQLYDLAPGYINSFFKVNGTFGNPDHLAGYLVSVIPFALGIYKYVNVEEGLGKILKYLALATFLVCLFILPSLRIRSSWIAVLVGIGIIYFYKPEIKVKINKVINNSFKKGLAILLFAALFTYSIIFLYKIKPASADGRLLIWKITSEIIKENPIWGIGFDRFASEYGNYQADYFDDDKGNDYERFLSGNVNHAHNEYLHTWAELGIVGLILWLGIMISALWGYKENDLPPPNIKLIVGLKNCAKASLISLIIVSVFSFPLHILPTCINFIFFISILSAVSKLSSSFSLKAFHFEIPYYLKTAFAFSAIAFVSFIFIENYKVYNAYKLWNMGYELAAYGQYDESLIKFEEAYPILQSNGEYLFNYGGVLLLHNEFKKAAFLLEESKKNYLDPKQYINLGICYENMGEYNKAEQSYKHAVNMEPNKIYQKYLLAKLYMKEKKNEQAKNECEKIMKMKVKIETTAALQMKEEIKALLTTINNPTLSGN